MDRRQFLKASLGSAASLTGIGVTSASAGGHGRLGTFSGRSDHIVTGHGELAADELVLLSDFSLDGAPDPRVGLGRDGAYDPASDLGALQSLTGAQSYPLPAGLNAEDYTEIFIWCRKFNVPLGVAKFR